MEQFDLRTIGGPQFNVTVDHTEEVIKVKVIEAKLLYEIIRAHTLLLDLPLCEDIDNLVDLFTGFNLSPFDLSWYTTVKPTGAYEKAVELAMREGNTTVVLEIINPSSDKGPRGR